MTISSVLVGFATGDQRQIPPAEGAEPAASDSASALQAGPWSAIDWEFGSVLRALIPEGKDEPVKTSGTGGEKTDTSEAAGVEIAAPQTVTSLPKVFPATFSLAFDRDIEQPALAPLPDVAPDAPVSIRVAPRTEHLEADAVSVKTFVAETDVPRTSSLSVVTKAPITKPDVTPLDNRVESRTNNLKIIALPAAKSTPEGEVVRILPSRTFDAPQKLRPNVLPLGIRIEPQPKGAEANTLKAEIAHTPVIRTLNIVPFPPSSPPLDLGVESPQSHASTVIPVKANTLEAEVVSTPAVQTSHIVPAALSSALPLDARVESQPKVPGTSAIPVRTNIHTVEVVDAAAIQTPEVVPDLRPSVPPEYPRSNDVDVPVEGATAVRNSYTTPTPRLNPVTVDVQESKVVSLNEKAPEAPIVRAMPAPSSDGARKLRVDAPPEDSAGSAAPEKEDAHEPAAIRIAARVSKPAVVHAAQVAFSPDIQRVQTVNVEKPQARVNVERNQRPANPPSEADSTKKTASPVAEVPVPAPPVIKSTPQPVEAAGRKSPDSTPTLATVSEEHPLSLPGSKDFEEAPAPLPAPNTVAPVLQHAVALAAAPRPADSEKRSDDHQPKSHPTGLIAVQESKPEPTPAHESPDLPALTANRGSADLSRSFVVESKTKGDRLSPADTEVAFTGRLVPRKVAEEQVSRPEASRPIERLTQPDSVEVKPAREIEPPPVERQVRPVTEGRTEHGILVSAVHRDTAPAPVIRPAEAPLPTRSTSSEIIQEPVNRESSGPVREISMRFNDPAQESAHLRVVAKGGEVLVSVRSGSEQLARTLSSDLGDLAHRLEQTGFQAELYRPAAQSSSSEPGHDRRDNSSTVGQNGAQSWSRERRDSQQHPGQQPREWVDDLEESMGLSQ